MATITTAFSGTLNSNKWISGLYNAYKYILTISGNLKFDDRITSMFRQEADLYHDKYVVTDVDVLDFSADYDTSLGSTQLNVLALEQRGSVKQQELSLNINKYLGFTQGPWFKKQVWGSPDVYETFESTLLAQQINTIKLFEEQMVKQTIGCTLKGDTTKQNVTVTFATSTGTGKTDETTSVTTTFTNAEELIRLNATKFFEKVNEVLIDLAEPSRDYNDNGYYKNFKSDELVMFISSKYYVDFCKAAPIMMRDSGDFKKIFDGAIVLHEKYFGTDWAKGAAINSTYVDTSTHKLKSAGQGKARFANEYTISSTNYKIGEVVPNDLVIEGSGKYLYDLYLVDDSKICKIFAKDGVKYLVRIDSEQEEFRNPKARVTNMYTFYEAGKPMILAGKPAITISKA